MVFNKQIAKIIKKADITFPLGYKVVRWHLKPTVC